MGNLQSRTCEAKGLKVRLVQITRIPILERRPNGKLPSTTAGYTALDIRSRREIQNSSVIFPCKEHRETKGHPSPPITFHYSSSGSLSPLYHGPDYKSTPLSQSSCHFTAYLNSSFFLCFPSLDAGKYNPNFSNLKLQTSSSNRRYAKLTHHPLLIPLRPCRLGNSL